MYMYPELPFHICLTYNILFLSDNANEKTSKVFNPAWAWFGAVLTILLVSTAVVVIRRFKLARRNITNEVEYATQSEVVTGYARFWNSDSVWNIPHPVPKFWRVSLPEEQSNPGSRQYIYRFPIPAPHLVKSRIPWIPFQILFKVSPLRTWTSQFITLRRACIVLFVKFHWWGITTLSKALSLGE